MTGPLLVPDPHGAYRARLERFDDHGRASVVDEVRFSSGWMAREWLRHHVVRDGVDAADRRYRVRADNVSTAAVIYDLSGSPHDIAVRLALLGRAGFDETRVVDPPSELSVELARALAGDYRHFGEQLFLLNSIGTPAGSPEIQDLLHERDLLRRVITQYAVTSPPLSQDSHIYLAQVMLGQDVAFLHEHGGSYQARYQRTDPRPLDESATSARSASFGNLAHAREWLLSQAADTVLFEQFSGVDSDVRAEITEADDGQVLFEFQGRPARLGGQLDSAETGEVFLTAVASVDDLHLHHAVEAHEQAVDYLIDLVNSAGPDPDHALKMTVADISMQGMQLAGAAFGRAEYASHAETESALARLHAGRARLRAPYNNIDSAQVPSSGFLRADIQVALGHLEALTAQAVHTDADPAAATVSNEQAGHRIAEVRVRIDELTAHPTLTDDDRELIRAEVTRLSLDPTPRPVTLYPWPSLGALADRTAALTTNSVGPDRPAFHNAVRLHHLTRVIATHPTRSDNPQRRDALDALLQRQNRYLTQCSTLPADLTAGARQAVTDTIDHHPLRPIPAVRAVHPSPAHPPHSAPSPTSNTPLRHYMLSIPDPTNSGREWRVGLENGGWVAHSYLPYPAAAELRVEEAVTRFDTATHLLDALSTGITYRDRNGVDRRLPAVQVDNGIRAALGHAQQIHDHQRPRPAAKTPRTPRRIAPRPPNPPPRRRL